MKKQLTLKQKYIFTIGYNKFNMVKNCNQVYEIKAFTNKVSSFLAKHFSSIIEQFFNWK